MTEPVKPTEKYFKNEWFNRPEMFLNLSAVEHSAILNPAPTGVHGHDPIHPLTHLAAFVGLRARPHVAEEILSPTAHIKEERLRFNMINTNK